MSQQPDSVTGASLSRVHGDPLKAKVHPTVVHMLKDAAERAPDREALVCGDVRLTYAEFLSCVAAFAHELQGLGAAGQRVAMILGNSLETAVAMFAIHAAGAQEVPLNPTYSDRELTDLLSDSAPVIVLCEAARLASIEPISARLGIRVCLGLGGGGKLLSDPDARRNKFDLPSLPNPGDLATLQYTGGTSGRPKGVNSLHGPMSFNVAQREGVVATMEGERVLCVMPLFHVYATSTALYLSVYARGTLVILPKYRPDILLHTLTAERITFFPGSPTLFTGLMAYEGFARTDFSSLRVCFSGASALPEQTLEQWESMVGCPVYEGYGQSEAGPVLSANPVGGIRKARSVGIAIPETEIEIVDVESGSKVLPRGAHGEIRARGPQLMSGYRNRPKESAEALRDGWLYTGDIGEIDNDGYLFIRGRKNDMVIVSGYNVYPREVEDVLHMSPAVKEAAAIGVPDHYRGEVVMAYVVLKDAAAVEADELLAHCAGNLAKYKVPAAIEIVDEIPKTAVGKVDKVELRRQAQFATKA